MRDVRATTAGPEAFTTTPALGYISPGLRALAMPISELQSAPDNARRHSPAKDLPVLMHSLRRFGQAKPIVGKRSYRGLANVVLAGNGTLAAARELGWSHVAVAWFDGTDDEARQYALADNATAERSSWDADALQAFAADGVDLAIWWGNDKPALDALLDLPVTDADWSTAFDALPSGERAPIQQMTFTLSDGQADRVRVALTAAKRRGPFDDSDNVNANGCALARIVDAFLATEAGNP
jgi:ParB family chromosome partitioning protein